MRNGYEIVIAVDGQEGILSLLKNIFGLKICLPVRIATGD